MPARWFPKQIAVVVLTLAILTLPVSAAAVEVPSQTKHVLVLNSYDAAYAWTANVVAGVRSVLDPLDSVELSIEFMDSKKTFTPEYAELLSQLYARKYAHMGFDLIVSSDDDALDFLIRYREQLFPGVPLVFCGVNNFRQDRLLGFANVTGVKEQNDFDKNLDWIAELRPSTHKILFITDQSATSKAHVRQIKEIEPHWRGRFEIGFTPPLSVGELDRLLRGLSQDTVVFWSMFMRDKDGTPLSMAASHRLVVGASPVPVFGFSDVSVGHGAVGGYVVSAFTQGATAARMGVRILDGTPAADIPVEESPNVYTADYAAFERWHLDVEHLPPGAVVLNRPFSFYERYRAYVWAALGGMGAESLAILGLIVTIRSLTRKSRAKLRESEERYRSIAEDGSELICRFDLDQKIVFVNGAMSRLIVMPVDAIVGCSFGSVLTDPDWEGTRLRIQALTPQDPVLSMEQPSRAASGDQRWVLWTYRGLFGPEGQLTEVQAVGHDITGRREAELALHAALQRVADGNARLATSNESLQRVLDSMREGLLVCDRRGVLTATRSRALIEWFGEPSAEAVISEYLFDAGSRARDNFEAAFEQLSAEILPFELAADQLPQSFCRGERSYGLECHPVFRHGQFSEIVFVIADTTEQIAQSLQLQRTQELTTVVGNLMRNPRGFHDFLAETEQLLAALRVETDSLVMRRSLHTLKGSTASYGFAIFAGHCHILEDAIALDPKEPTPASIESLTREWKTSSAGVSVFFESEDTDRVSLSADEYNDLLSRLESQRSPAQLAELWQTARRWVNPPMSQVLAVFAQTARQVAHKLEKDVEVEILDHGLRLPLAELESFFSVLVHVVRNCIDHGIERPEERARRGKPQAGQLSIESRQEGAEFVVTIRDDGQGIDWDAVRERALSSSLPAKSASDLVDALFADGFSTRVEVSETSGRGVGLGAVRRACEALGGSIQVTSRRQEGTQFEFRFLLSPGALLTKERGVLQNEALAS